MNKSINLTGFKQLYYGADYNPDQWLDRPDILDEDIRLMKKIGVTSASIGIFSWTSFEPEEGQFEFGWLDKIMDRFAKEGLFVFLATPSGSKPMWMSEKYSEIRRVQADGSREPSGGRHNHCPSSPVYREKVYRINTELAKRYGKHPALALWHIGNEFRGDCHCDICKDAFHQWLKDKYGDLDTLNKSWWTAFWNHTFTDWSQIPSHDKSIDGLQLDWLRFVNDQHCSFILKEMAPLREFSPNIPCTTNFMGFHGGNNYWQWSEILDVICNDSYPTYDDREDTWKKSIGTDFVHSLMRGLARRKPWLLMESSPSAVNWGAINKLKRPGVHLQECMQAVAHGADAIKYFQWRKSRGGFEKFHGAVVDHAGGPGTRVFQDCQDVGDWLKNLSSLKNFECPPSPIGLLYDWDSRWALDASIGPKKIYGSAGARYFEACSEHFRALRIAGLDADVISVKSEFDQYKIVLTPALYLLSKATAEKLKAFTESGGIWIATYLTGYVDECNRCWMNGFPGPGLREVFGIWNEEIDYLYDEERVALAGSLFPKEHQGTASEIVEVLHAEGAEVLARADSEFYAGKPLITRNKFGSGYAYYLGAHMDEKSTISFYKHLAIDAGLESTDLPKGVLSKKRMSSNGEVEFLFNYRKMEVSLDLGEKEFIACSNGEIYSGKVSLAPYETLVSGNAMTAPVGETR